MAGAGGTEFTQVYDQLTGWANGTLGKVLGIAALLVGLGVGVIKQPVIAAVVGTFMALTAGFGPRRDRWPRSPRALQSRPRSKFTNVLNLRGI